MATYTTLSGHAIDYEASPALQAFIQRVQDLAEDPKTTEDDLVVLVYGRENPLLDHDAIPGRGAVTAAVLADPAYRVLTDLIFRKHIEQHQVDVEKLAARYTLSIREAAERLGVHYSAVQQAVESGRLGSWIKDGRPFIDPQALATFKLSPRGPKPKKSPAAPRASSEPLQVHAGSAAGRTMHVKHAGGELASSGRTAAGEIVPWRRVGVFTGGGGKARFVVLEPGEAEAEIAWGEFFVRGRFAVAEKVNNTRKAREAWEQFQAA